MTFADLALSKRLERAEAHAGAQFAEARGRLFPQSGACWTNCAGVYAVFDGVDSPITQTFGLGLFEDLDPASLDAIEKFFQDRNAPVLHEVSPFAGVAALSLLCERNYRPHELSSVLYSPVEAPAPTIPGNIRVRLIEPNDATLWREVNVRGWSHDHPELQNFLGEIGTVFSARQGGLCFLAEMDGVPGAAGALFIHEGVALFAGAATVPEMRRRGLQTALLEERIRYAAGHGCDLAMMVALPGSESQRNAERKGFRIAYTRIKWRLYSDQ